jgi:flagellar biosynthesis protein FlhA
MKGKPTGGNTVFIVAATVLLAIFVMLVPLPSLILDMLLVLNMGLAFLLVLLALSFEEISQISVFPTLVLGMTMGRLVLNVASTRLILTQGTKFGGIIVKAFGSFVVGGNYGVGVVLFLILVCIQVLVISKGSERVAEVAARFALDGLPMKQAGIETRVSNGVISPEEAEVERMNLQQEADFFGSMDGASKYVKGENLAGLVITGINFFAGLTLGMLNGGGAATELLATYALLTIGDGLVGLVPSLLLAAATGFIITKTEGEGSLSLRVFSEIFQSYHAVGAAFMGVGLFVTVLGLFSGVDPLGFFILAVLCFGIAGLFLFSAEEHSASLGEDGRDEQILVELHPDLLESLQKMHPGGLEANLKAASDRLRKERGVEVEAPAVRSGEGLMEGEWQVLLHGNPAGGGRMDDQRYLAVFTGEVPGERLEGDPDKDPLGNRPAMLIAPDAVGEAARLGCQIYDPVDLLGVRVSEVLLERAHDILGQDETEAWLREAQDRYPAVVREARSAHQSTEIKTLLLGLLRENISIRFPRPILESLSQRTGARGQALLELVRQDLARSIVRPLLVDGGGLPALTLMPSAESELKASLIQGEDGGWHLHPPMDLSADLLSGARARSEGMRRKGFIPCLLVSRGLRPHLYRFLIGSIPDLRVLAYEEAGAVRILNQGRLDRFQSLKPSHKVNT